jgi:hypothetical protein
MALMRWSIVCTPKQFGGLGLLNLKYMNRALLLKWWWRFSVDSVYLWKSILILKYRFKTTGSISFFRKSVLSLIPFTRINQKRLVGSDTSILFWYDVWFGEVLFYILFLNLFAKVKSPGVLTLVQVWNHGDIKIPLMWGARLLLRREKSELISIIFTLSTNFIVQDSAV